MQRSAFRAVRLPAGLRPPCLPRAGQRWQSTGAGKSKPSSVRSRFDRLIDRSPRFLRPTLKGLKDAPVSHVTAFFILHEITAIVPLLGLAGAFHYWRWLPPYFAEGAWVSSGVEMFGRYFRKKGWISERDEEIVEGETKKGKAGWFEERKISAGFNQGENATRWIVEFATAYAIVKALLPLRIFISVCASPWFARWTIIPIGKAIRSSSLLGSLRNPP